MAAPDLDETGIRDLIPISSGGSGSCSRSAGSGRVSAFLVKLTDSSLKALKASQKRASDGGEACRIELNGDRGSIHFPGVSAGEGKKGAKDAKFTLAVSDIQRDLGLDGRLDVISGVDESDQLLALGSDIEPFKLFGGIQKKIVINATDTTFDEVRQKAMRQEEDQRKSAAKELKQKGMKPARKSPPLPNLGRSSDDKGSSTGNPSLGAKTAGKPLRQRLVHMLAVKQMKKTEIRERLKKEGLSPMDEKQFESVLGDVSAKIGADKDKLILKPALLKSEVDVNWPGYGSWERSSIKSKIKGKDLGQSANYLGFQKKTEPLPPQAPQPKSNNSAQNAPASSASSNILDELIPKDSDHSQNGKSDLKRKSGGPTPPHESGVSPPNTSPSTMAEYLAPPQQKKMRRAHSSVKDPPPLKTSSPKVRPTNENSLTPPLLPVMEDSSLTQYQTIPSPTPSEPRRDWSEDFPPIETTEQRSRYGAAFKAEYDEYGKSHANLAAVGKEFSELDRRLQKAPKETKERKKIEREIVEKYKHYLADQEFMLLKRRHDELREKLAFIKERVKDFDTKQRKKMVERQQKARSATNQRSSAKKGTNENRRQDSSGISPPQDPQHEHPVVFQESNGAADLMVM